MLEATLVVIGVASLLVSIVLLALCAGDDEKKQDAQDEFSTTLQPTAADHDLEMHERRNSVVAMEGNPLYRGTRAKSPPTVDPQDVDEDELANQDMAEHSLRENRLRTATGSDMEKPSFLKLQSGTTPWLHYGLKKPDAERLVREECVRSKKDGVFLVRAKKPQAGLYALDIAWIDHNQVIVRSHVIQRNDVGLYLIDDQSYDRHNTLEELIRALARPRNKYFNKPLTHYVKAAEDQLIPKESLSAAC